MEDEKRLYHSFPDVVILVREIERMITRVGFHFRTKPTRPDPTRPVWALTRKPGPGRVLNDLKIWAAGVLVII